MKASKLRLELQLCTFQWLWVGENNSHGVPERLRFFYMPVAAWKREWLETSSAIFFFVLTRVTKTTKAVWDTMCWKRGLKEQFGCSEEDLCQLQSTAVGTTPSLKKRQEYLCRKWGHVVLGRKRVSSTKNNPWEYAIFRFFFSMR